jgi:small ligand-binding sensory domain FIST
MTPKMLFASATTTERESGSAVASLVEQVQAQLVGPAQLDGQAGMATVDLALVFLSAHFTGQARSIAAELQAELRPGVLLGCTAEGVIGRHEELEGQAAITLVAAYLPGVRIVPFVFENTDWRATLLECVEFRRLVGAPDDTRLFVLLGDPFSTPMDDLLEAFNNAYPGLPVIGGMASGALRAQGNALILNDLANNVGVVGVALAGELDVDVVVSQGCRPIWRPFTISAAHWNEIYLLEERPPLVWIQDLMQDLSEEDRLLLQNGLYVGRAINLSDDDIGRGDFLIRGIIGIDRESGAIAIGDTVQEGETIQFHLRDAFTAQEDIEMMLIPQAFRLPPEGALLFSCNGRGTRLYDHPDGDISVIQKSLGGTPLAGFFCAGEIGPIGGKNFMHGQTASLAIFRSSQAEA